jgi:hypothetical protein
MLREETEKAPIAATRLIQRDHLNAQSFSLHQLSIDGHPAHTLSHHLCAQIFHKMAPPKNEIRLRPRLDRGPKPGVATRGLEESRMPENL